MGDEDLTDTWIALARGLVAVSALVLAAGFVIVFGNSGISLRDRLFQASESATAVSGLFTLAGVAVLLATKAPGERVRGVLATARVIGVVIVACAMYAGVYALTRHTRWPQPEESTTFFAFVGINWWYRVSGMLGSFAAGVMGSLVVLTARRAATHTPIAVSPVR